METILNVFGSNALRQNVVFIHDILFSCTNDNNRCFVLVAVSRVCSMIDIGTIILTTVVDF